MKKVLIFLVVFWGATIATFSQRVVLNMEVPKLEKGAIKRVRKVFKIPKKTELYATIVVFPNDTVRFNHYELPFDFNRTLYDYLQKLKFHNTAYEVFVFDKQLTNVYVVHRIFFSTILACDYCGSVYHGFNLCARKTSEFCGKIFRPAVGSVFFVF